MEMFVSSDHRVADNFNITLRNIDAISEHAVSNQNASLFFSFRSVVCKLLGMRDSGIYLKILITAVIMVVNG